MARFDHPLRRSAPVRSGRAPARNKLRRREEWVDASYKRAGSFVNRLARIHVWRSRDNGVRYGRVILVRTIGGGTQVRYISTAEIEISGIGESRKSWTDRKIGNRVAPPWSPSKWVNSRSIRKWRGGYFRRFGQETVGLVRRRAKATRRPAHSTKATRR